MKKHKKLNLRKLSIAKLKESSRIIGGRTSDWKEGTKTRTMCGDSCGAEVSIDNTPCREL